MATDKELGSVGQDDDLDLDDLDIDMSEFDLDPDGNIGTDNRNPVDRVLSDTTTAFTDEFTDSPLDAAADIARAAIPDQLSKETDIVIDAADTIQTEFNNAGKEVKKQANRTFNTIKKYIPQGNERIDNIVNRISYFLGDGRSSPKGPSQAELIKNDLVNALGEKQDLTSVESLIKEQIDANRSKSQQDILSVIAVNTERTRKFQFEIQDNYYRKTMELRLKSYYLQNELVTVTKTAFDIFKTQLEAVSKNTALPDIVKLRSTEALKAAMLQGSAAAVSDKLFGGTGPLGNFQRNVKAKFTDIKDSIIGGLDQVESMAGVSEGLAEAGVSKGTMLGSLIATYSKDEAGVRLGETIMDSPGAQKRAISIKNDMADPHKFFKNKANLAENDATSFIFEQLADLTKNNMRKSYTFNEKVNDDPAIFDNRAHTSIVEVIPQLLGKSYGIQKSIYEAMSKAGSGNGSIRDTNPSPEDNTLVYDPVTKKLSTVTEVKTNFQKRADKSLMKGSSRYASELATVLISYSNMEISDEDIPLLRNSIIKYSLSKDSSLAPFDLAKKSFIKYLDPKIKTKYPKNLIKKKLETDLVMFNKAASLLAAIRRGFSSYEKELKEYDKAGINEVGFDSGIIKIDKDTGLKKSSKKGLSEFVIQTDAGLSQSSLDEIKNKELIEKELARLAEEKGGKNKKQFHTGGYTGDAGKYEKTGEVHGSEYVINKEELEDVVEAGQKGDHKSKLEFVQNIYDDVASSTGVQKLKSAAEEAGEKVMSFLDTQFDKNKFTYGHDTMTDEQLEDETKLTSGKATLLDRLHKMLFKAEKHIVSLDVREASVTSRLQKTAIEGLKLLGDTKDTVLSNINTYYDSLGDEDSSLLDKAKLASTDAFGVVKKGASVVDEQLSKDNTGVYDTVRQNAVETGDTLGRKARIAKQNIDNVTNDLQEDLGTFVDDLKEDAVGTLEKTGRKALHRANVERKRATRIVKSSFNDKVREVKDKLIEDLDDSKEKSPARQRLDKRNNVLEKRDTILDKRSKDPNQNKPRSKLEQRRVEISRKDEPTLAELAMDKAGKAIGYESLSDDIKDKLKLDYLNSEEYKSGSVSSFVEWAKDIRNIDFTEYDFSKENLTKELNTKYKTVKDWFYGKMGLTNEKEETVEELKLIDKVEENSMASLFALSPEYKSGELTDFDEWLRIKGYRRDKGNIIDKFSDGHERLLSFIPKDTVLAKFLTKTRALDKLIMKTAFGGLLKVMDLARKGAWWGTKQLSSLAWKGLKTIPKLTNPEKYGKSESYKAARKADKTIVKTGAKAVAALPKLAWNAGGLAKDVTTGVIGSLSNTLLGSKFEGVNKIGNRFKDEDSKTSGWDKLLSYFKSKDLEEDQEESQAEDERLKKEKATKKAEKTRIAKEKSKSLRAKWLQKFNKKDDKDDVSDKSSTTKSMLPKEKKETSLFTLTNVVTGLLGAVTLIKSGIDKVKEYTSGIATAGKGILGLLANVVKGVIGLPGKIVSGLATVLSKIPMLGDIFKPSVKDGVPKTSDNKKSKVTNIADHKPNESKKGMANRIKSFLSRLKGKVIKRLGFKAGSSLLAKIAMRGVPVLGWSLLLIDAGRTIYFLSQGYDFQSSVSKAVLGSDIFNENEIPVDDQGRPITTELEVDKDKLPDNVIDGRSIFKNKHDPEYGLVDGESNPIEGRQPGSVTPIRSPLHQGPINTNTALTNIVVPDNVDVNNINPEMRDNLARMTNDYYNETGKKVRLNSGYRSYEYQMKLRKELGEKAARPGHSTHEYGLAFDINQDTADELEELGLMRKYGFTRPVGGEPWHIEPAGIQYDVNRAKQDNVFATNMIKASLNKGGGGAALHDVPKYRRDKGLQIKTMEMDNNVVPMINPTARANSVVDEALKQVFKRPDNAGQMASYSEPDVVRNNDIDSKIITAIETGNVLGSKTANILKETNTTSNESLSTLGQILLALEDISTKLDRDTEVIIEGNNETVADNTEVKQPNIKVNQTLPPPALSVKRKKYG